MSERNVGPVLLSVENLSKSFTGTKALSGVAFSLRPGEILALLGHNGSGKSTLVKVLAGIYRPDDGSVVHVDCGIHFIHQDLGLVPSLSTVENLALGGERRWRDLLPLRRDEIASARAAIARFGGTFDVTAPISRITPAERTIVAIARAMSSWTGDRNVLVLDEPTATLHGDEAERLRQVVRDLAADGVGIIYISHHLPEVVDLADRALVLRNGMAVADLPRGGFDEASLVRAISGEGATSRRTDATSTATYAALRLSVRGLVANRIVGADLDVRAGEILGVAGLLGSGREELLATIFGSRPAYIESLEVDGRRVKSGTPHAAIAAGIGFVPADRRGLAAVTTMNARENLTLASLPRLGPLRPASERATALGELRAVAVHPLDTERRFGLFSGGNQQKVVIAKWLRTNPSVLLMDEPTQGVDVGARAGIHDLIRAKAATGTAFVIASSDEEELADVCDRILVFRDGRIEEELRTDAITRDNVLRASLTKQIEPMEVTQ